MYERLNALGIGLLTLALFGFTTRPDVQIILPRLFVFYLLFSVFGYCYYLYARGQKIVTRTTTIFGYLITATLFLLIAATGWFYSPFIYLSYVLGVVYVFLFGSLVTVAYSFVMVVIYLYDVSKYGLLWSDYIMLLTLMLITPAGYFLKKFYLLIAQQQKKILILEEQKTMPNGDSADELLTNKITRFAVELRQDASDLRQIGLIMQANKAIDEEIKHRAHEIVDLSQNLLKKVEDFEGVATGRKLTHQY